MGILDDYLEERVIFLQDGAVRLRGLVLKEVIYTRIEIRELRLLKILGRGRLGKYDPGFDVALAPLEYLFAILRRRDNFVVD